MPKRKLTRNGLLICIVACACRTAVPWTGTAYSTARAAVRHQTCTTRHCRAPITLTRSLHAVALSEEAALAADTESSSTATSQAQQAVDTNTQHLPLGAAAEYWHANSICYGTFMGTLPGKKSLRMSSKPGKETVIDAGQLIAVWRADTMRGLLPERPEHWQAVNIQANDILTKLNPKSLDLQELWQIARTQKKGVVVGTTDVAKWLFGMKGRYGKWRTQAYQLDTDTVAASGNYEAYTYQPSPSERLAAGKVLADELHRFKRIPCTLLQLEPHVLLSKGGFKPVVAAVVATNEVSACAAIVKQHGTSAVHKLTDPAHKQIIYSIELLAMGSDASTALSPDAQKVLKELKCDATVTAARKLLVDMGVWTTAQQQQQQQQQGDSTSNAKQPVRRVVIPWSADMLQQAQELQTQRAKRTDMYTTGTLANVQQQLGAALPNGRKDYRAAPYSVYSIDADATNFLDDALSWDPVRSELSVHIADVQGYVREGTLLDDTAKARVETQYLAHGQQPMFMMPPRALQAVSLSDTQPNECISIVMQIDAATGAVASSRILLTALPPVKALTYDEANTLYGSNSGSDADSNAANTELQQLVAVVKRVYEHTHMSSKESTVTPLLQRTASGEAQHSYTHRDTPTHVCVSQALSLYTDVAVRACKRAGVAIPTLLGHEDRVQSGRTRYATAPLRRYIDLLAQRQLCAVLGKRPLLGKKTIGEAVHAIMPTRNAQLAVDRAQDLALKYDLLAQHCNKLQQLTGQSYASVSATATGNGSEVCIDDVGIRFYIKGNDRSANKRKPTDSDDAQQQQQLPSWRAGHKLTVHITHVDTQQQRIRVAPPAKVAVAAAKTASSLQQEQNVQ